MDYVVGIFGLGGFGVRVCSPPPKLATHLDGVDLQNPRELSKVSAPHVHAAALELVQDNAPVLLLLTCLGLCRFLGVLWLGVFMWGVLGSYSATQPEGHSS